MNSGVGVAWALLPGVSALCPLVGHTGFIASDGTVHDFAGTRTILAHRAGQTCFGPVRRVWLLEDVDAEDWDDAVREANDHFALLPHNFITNNCHHHVCRALNRLAVGGRRDWNPPRLVLALLSRGRFLSPAHAARTLLPPVLILLAIAVLLCLCLIEH